MTTIGSDVSKRQQWERNNICWDENDNENDDYCDDDYTEMT